MADPAPGATEPTDLVVSRPVQSRIGALDHDLAQYLKTLELPDKGILAPLSERAKVFALLPQVVSVLRPEQKADAFYLSKFAAASAVGLFDAALNYLWDATVVELRGRVVLFDLSYFYDVTVTDPTERTRFQTVEDLVNLRDWDLIRGCKEIGLLSEIAYRQLDFVRDMRNYASAAHPNLYEVTGINLVAWLETCLRNVQAAPAEGPLIEIKRLVISLRSATLDDKQARPIQTSVKGLPGDLAISLLQATFGMYIDPDLEERVRTNVDLISASVWGRCGESARRGIGIKYGILAANGETVRAEFARRFLSRVDGLSYLPKAQLTVEIAECLSSLQKAHFAWGNFFNEEPHARTLLRLVPKSGEIPTDIIEDYVRVLVVCKLGNFYGVAHTAEPYYDQLIGMFRDPQIVEFIESVRFDPIIQALADRKRAILFSRLAKALEPRTTNPVFSTALRAYSAAPPEQMRDPKFIQKVTSLLGT
jgi:hypothetical protein